MKHGIRLEECGDNLTVEEYSAWMIQSPNTTYQQLHDGTTLVQPWTLKPKPLWRNTDCAATQARRDLVVQQRKDRVRRKMGLVKTEAKAS